MTFQQATAVTPVTSHTYGVNLSEDWCIGSVPNGGYVSSVLLTAVQAHFSGTLSHLNQPDTMSIQLQFLRRTQVGPATISIEHLKLGSTTSTIQVILSQGDRLEVQGLIVQTNFSKQTGLSLSTSFIASFMSSAPPPIDFAAVEKSGEDRNWLREDTPPHGDFRRAVRHILFHHPKRPTDPSLVDQWIRFRPGGPGNYPVPFTQEALGFVADIFPSLIDQFPEAKGTARWYPTVALNLDIKRNLPPGGANWLFVRVRAGEIRNGRIDLQIIVLDQFGDLVLLSSHVSLILSSERNLAKRGPADDRVQEIGGKL